MVRTRSSAVSSRAVSSSAQKPPCSSSSSCSSSCARRRNRRRRTVAMPERKRKLRRQKALQKQIAIAKASEPILTAELGKRNTKSSLNSSCQQSFLSPRPGNNRNPNPTEAFQKFTQKSFNIDQNNSRASNRSLKAKRKKPVATVEEEKNSAYTEECRKYSRNREKRNQYALILDTCKKVRISEAANACSEECDRDQVVENGNGWTSEQDFALQNAYFQVRPSSHFWFEVSKKVSGKSAKDCFDRFYSVHPTPPTTQPRTRKLAAESPVRTISFPSPMPSLNCKLRFSRSKQGLLKAHQTVRHILRQQRVADGTYEADVFTLVEQSNSMLQDWTNRAVSPLPALKGKDTFSGNLVGTPASCNGDAKSEWWSVSSKQKPQYGPDENTYPVSSATKSQLLSPEVLKAEHNPGRLDRFLDILHLRRVERRKNPSSAKGVSQGSQDNPKAEKTFTQCVAAAREAIITDTMEVLRMATQQKATEVEEETSFLSDHVEGESSDMSED